jgi:hypothetical protein
MWGKGVWKGSKKQKVELHYSGADSMNKCINTKTLQKLDKTNIFERKQSENY